MKLTEQQLKKLLYPEFYRPVSVPEARGEIGESAQQLFGRPVLFEERAFQALEVTTPHGKTPNTDHVWSQLLGSVPAITALYKSLDIDFEGWPGPPMPLNRDVHDLGTIEWSRTLRAIFMRGKSLTTVGELVARTGVVTVRDLVVSMLQSSQQAFREPDANTLRTSLPLRRIARQAMFGKDAHALLASRTAHIWSKPLEEFASKAADTFDKLYSFDPSCGAQQFILYHDGRKARVQPFGLSGVYQLQEGPLPDGSLWIARGNVIQPATRFSERAIEELENLINGGKKEAAFQSFFEKHPEFLLALGDYVNLHPQLILSEDTGSRLIPDFFLEKMDSGFCDICDLKRPTAELVRYQKSRHRFRDAVMEAVAQLTLYKDWIEERDHRDLFYQRYGLKAFRPRVVVVIGRRMSFIDDVKRLSLESELPRWVTLKTYDDVVSGARRWRRVFDGT